MIDWEKQFAEAHETSWPTTTLMVSKVNPGASQGGRSIYGDDKDKIDAAAKRNGYVVLFETLNAVHFINRDHGVRK